ncbi:MAG: DNA-3-methyladenine glycosylase I [Simkaniaceae bacterium]|nr:DNA-3-methyladenine glycosylase I [Simkaniaceae bacterium]
MRENTNKKRCFGDSSTLYSHYHDFEWGIPSYDDRHLFELLSLEGAQAGLSWETILKRRKSYKELFHNFVIDRASAMSDIELEALIQNPAIIRNRLKIFSVRKNARVALEIQKEYKSLSNYFLGFVDHPPKNNQYQSLSEIPVKTSVSEAISKDLKKRGMSFVGPTIMYAFMQAVGMVNDHLITCPVKEVECTLT